RDEGDAVRLAKVVGLDDVRVDQVGHKLGLADEIFDEHLLAGVVGPDDFDGDPLDEIAGAMLLRLIHDAHATLENFPGDFITKFVLNREKCHARMVGNWSALSSPARG